MGIEERADVIFGKGNASVSKIIGCPGTGKTTAILKLIDRACDTYKFNEIGAVSYTNAAVNTMRNRIRKNTKARWEEISNIRTIHSHCFKLLGLTRKQVADVKIDEWNELYPHFELPENTSIREDEHYADINSESYAANRNKKIFQKMIILRNLGLPKEEWHKVPDNQIRTFHSQIIRMSEAWEHFMFKYDYYDYTKMIEECIEKKLMPEVNILFVDESQDLTYLQLKLLEIWSHNVKATIFSGDSDQAIFRFAGAAPEVFARLKNDWKWVLEKSFRVPKKVHSYAMSIINRVLTREDVVYEPRDGSEGVFIPRCKVPDFSLEGSHMILGRCNYHLNYWRQYLISKGMPWHNPYRPGDKSWNPTNTRLWKAATSYVRLKLGEDVETKDVKHMISEMISKDNLIRGAKSNVDMMLPEDETEKLDFFNLIDLGFFTQSFLSFKKTIPEVFHTKGQIGKIVAGLKEETFMEGPRVILGTCHSVKGGEASHVWIDTSTSPQCLGAMRTPLYRDDEIRVAYVAATRTKHTLGLLAPRGMYNPAFPKTVNV